MAELRGAATHGQDRLHRAAVVLGLLAIAVYAPVLAGFLSRAGSNPAGTVKIDFAALWAAGRLALEGKVLAAFDPARLEAAMRLPASELPAGLRWLYPPAMLMLVVPLGLMPFLPAWVVFSAGSLAAYGRAVWGLAGSLPGGHWYALASPAVLQVLAIGQVSLLWTAGLVAALAALARGRGASAGALIALLTLKPQLGLMIPVALIAAGEWRAVAWAAIWSAGLVALASAAVGIGYWQGFAEALAAVGDMAAEGRLRTELMLSPYAAARELAAGHWPALAVQAAATLALAGAVWWLWRRPGDWARAGLCLAAPLATPYAYHAEWVLVLAGALYLARAGAWRSGAGLALMALIWLGATPLIPVAEAVAIPLFGLPLITLGLGRALIGAAGERVSAPLTRP